MLWEWSYAAALLLGALISVLIGVWVSRQPDIDNKRLFVFYHSISVHGTSSVSRLIAACSVALPQVSTTSS